MVEGSTLFQGCYFVAERGSEAGFQELDWNVFVRFFPNFLSYHRISRESYPLLDSSHSTEKGAT